MSSWEFLKSSITSNVVSSSTGAVWNLCGEGWDFAAVAMSFGEEKNCSERFWERSYSQRRDHQQHVLGHHCPVFQIHVHCVRPGLDACGRCLIEVACRIYLSPPMALRVLWKHWCKLELFREPRQVQFHVCTWNSCHPYTEQCRPQLWANFQDEVTKPALDRLKKSLFNGCGCHRLPFWWQLIPPSGARDKLSDFFCCIMSDMFSCFKMTHLNFNLKPRRPPMLLQGQHTKPTISICFHRTARLTKRFWNGQGPHSEQCQSSASSQVTFESKFVSWLNSITEIRPVGMRCQKSLLLGLPFGKISRNEQRHIW